MGDLISRQAVLEAIEDDTRLGMYSRFASNNDAQCFKDVIRELPSIENKGEWIAQDIHNCHTNFKCSECGYIHSFMHLYGEPTADYTYCPNCGARMKGGE